MCEPPASRERKRYPRHLVARRSERQLTAGIDLGGTKIQTVVLEGRKVVGSSRAMTPGAGSPSDVIEAIAGTAKDSLGQAGASADSLTGIGIGSPGEIDRELGIVQRADNVVPFAGQKVQLGHAVSSALGEVPVMIDNDVRVAVLGEHRRGAGRPYKDILGVWIGTGVGGGIILGGQLRDGRGAAGEIGHMVVDPKGRMCSCGRRGCLEAYAGRGKIEAHARELIAKGQKTELLKIMKKKGRDRFTSGVIAEALERGDRMAVKLIDDAVAALGVALASAQNLLDVEAIIIGGGLGDRLGEPFVARVAEAMTPHLFVPERPPTVLPTELKDLSGAVGAAVLAGG